MGQEDGEQINTHRSQQTISAKAAKFKNKLDQNKSSFAETGLLADNLDYSTKVPKNKLQFFEKIRKHVIDDLTNKDGDWDTIGFNNGIHEASHNTQKRKVKVAYKKLAMYVGFVILVKFVSNWILSNYFSSNLIFVLSFAASYFVFGSNYLTKQINVSRKFSLMRARTQIDLNAGELAHQLTNFFKGANVDHFDSMLKQTA